MPDQSHNQPNQDPVIEPRIRTLTLPASPGSGIWALRRPSSARTGLRPGSTARHSRQFRTLAHDILHRTQETLVRDAKRANRLAGVARDRNTWPVLRGTYKADRKTRPDILSWACRQLREEQTSSIDQGKKRGWAAFVEDGIEASSEKRLKNANRRTPLPGWPESTATQPQSPRSPPSSPSPSPSPPVSPKQQTANQPTETSTPSDSPQQDPTHFPPATSDDIEDENLRNEAVWYYHTLAASANAQTDEATAFRLARARMACRDRALREAAGERSYNEGRQAARALAARRVALRGWEWVMLERELFQAMEQAESYFEGPSSSSSSSDSDDE